jgi:hypothetical protein
MCWALISMPKILRDTQQDRGKPGCLNDFRMMAGGLMSYGPDLPTIFRRAARHMSTNFSRAKRLPIFRLSSRQNSSC